MDFIGCLVAYCGDFYRPGCVFFCSSIYITGEKEVLGYKIALISLEHICSVSLIFANESSQLSLLVQVCQTDLWHNYSKSIVSRTLQWAVRSPFKLPSIFCETPPGDNWLLSKGVVLFSLLQGLVDIRRHSMVKFRSPERLEVQG